MTTRTVKIGSTQLGVNNKLEPTQLDVVMPDRSKGRYLYGGDNVDINDKGFIRRRRGQTHIVGASAHSIWAARRAKTGYAVLDNTLVRLSPQGAGFDQHIIRTVMPPLPVSYSLGPDGDVYWTNKSVLRRITPAGEDRPVAPSAPTAPVATVGAGGSLPKGQYLLALTTVNDDGESPASPVQRLNVPEGGTISFTLTQAECVFLSGPDGDILTEQGTGDGLVTLSLYYDDGRRCPTLNTALMPPGAIVRHFKGSLLVAADNLLFFSLPYNYGIVEMRSSYIPFPAPITIVQPTDNGVYVCADKTYWLSSLQADGTLQDVLPYGGIPGTGGESSITTEVFWQSPQGLVLADENMSVKTPQANALEFGEAEFGATLFRKQDGITQLVAARSGAGQSTAAAGSFMEAQIIRKGTVL